MQVYVDCDGVLADFECGAQRVFGMSSEAATKSFGVSEFWRRLREQPDFYGSLPLLPGAEELMARLSRFHPIILTGAPRGEWAQPQKLAWGRRFFPSLSMIVCAAREKSQHCSPGDLLIDDWTRYKHLWLAAGGVFLHHRSAAQTLSELERLLPEGEDRP